MAYISSIITPNANLLGGIAKKRFTSSNPAMASQDTPGDASKTSLSSAFSCSSRSIAFAGKPESWKVMNIHLDFLAMAVLRSGHYGKIWRGDVRPCYTQTNWHSKILCGTVGTRQYGNTIEWWIWHLPSRRKRLQPSSSLNQEMLNQIYNISKHSIRFRNSSCMSQSPFVSPGLFRLFPCLWSFASLGSSPSLVLERLWSCAAPARGSSHVRYQAVGWPGERVVKHVVNGWRIGRKQMLTVDILVDHCGWIIVDGSLWMDHCGTFIWLKTTKTENIWEYGV